MRAARYIFFTSNLSAMVVFCHDTLGIPVVSPPKAMDYDSEDWVKLGNESFEIGIHRASRVGNQGRNRNKLVFIVDDVAEARERLSSLGVKMGKHHVRKEFECCDFKDPDGNLLQLSSR